MPHAVKKNRLLLHSVFAEKNTELFAFSVPVLRILGTLNRNRDFHSSARFLISYQNSQKHRPLYFVFKKVFGQSLIFTHPLTPNFHASSSFFCDRRWPSLLNAHFRSMNFAAAAWAMYEFLVIAQARKIVHLEKQKQSFDMQTFSLLPTCLIGLCISNGMIAQVPQSTFHRQYHNLRPQNPQTFAFMSKLATIFLLGLWQYP